MLLELAGVDVGLPGVPGGVDEELGLVAEQGGAQARAKLSIDAGVPEACVRYAAGHAGAAALGPMFGEISVEKIS